MQTILYWNLTGKPKVHKKEKVERKLILIKKIYISLKRVQSRSYSITSTKIGTTVLAENRKRIRFSVSVLMCEWGYRFVATLEKQEWDCLPTTSLGTKTWQTLNWGKGGGGGERGGRNNIHWPIREWHRSFSLLRHDLASVMTNRREWDRLMK